MKTMSSLVEKISTTQLASKVSDRVWNLLTLLVLFSTVCLVGVFALTFVNPTNGLNPFPPASASLADLATVTATPGFPPTWTRTPVPEPTATLTPEPAAPTAAAAAPAQPAVPAQPAEDATQPPANPNGYPFELRGTPIQVPSTISHANQGCKWLGVGGEVFDLQGSPLTGLTIQIGGSLDGKKVNMLSLTGTVTQYGPGGYEFSLGENPLDSEGALWLQLLDQAGLALSDRVPINTSKDCAKNLLLVNFKQVR
jgi:hypothetical protein